MKKKDAAEDVETGAAEVLSALDDAARQIVTYASGVMREQPGVALAAAGVAGFVAGGGLLSSLGMRLTTGTLRATIGNLATLVGLDLLRRTLEGDSRGGAARTTST